MRNRIRFALGEKKASPGSTPGILPSDHVKSLLEGYASELDQKEWVVANTGGRILCTRLADIVWVRSVAGGVELRIGRQAYHLHDTFESWVAKLPADRFARRGDSLLVNLRRVQPLRAALSSVFQRRSTGWATPFVSAASRKRSRPSLQSPESRS